MLLQLIREASVAGAVDTAAGRTDEFSVLLRRLEAGIPGHGASPASTDGSCEPPAGWPSKSPEGRLQVQIPRPGVPPTVSSRGDCPTD